MFAAEGYARATGKPGVVMATSGPGALNLVTGLVDSFSYLLLGHVFVANMTGNVVFLGFALAGAPGFSVGASLVALRRWATDTAHPVPLPLRLEVAVEKGVIDRLADAGNERNELGLEPREDGLHLGSPHAGQC